MPGQGCQIGLIGLGVMGKNFVLNMADHGFGVAVYYTKNPDLANLLVDDFFGREIMNRQADWRAVVQQAVAWRLAGAGFGCISSLF